MKYAQNNFFVSHSLSPKSTHWASGGLTTGGKLLSETIVYIYYEMFVQLKQVSKYTIQRVSYR